jgi:chromosome segregation ATPase
MSKTRKLVVNLGSSKGGLSTVGYTIYNEAGGTHKARSTSGVTELGTSTGIYKATVTLDDAFDGFIVWDSGDATIRYAVEPTLGQLNSIQDETDHIRIIWNSMRNQGEALTTLLELVRKKGNKSEELKSILQGIDKLSLKEYPKLKEIKDVLKVVLPEIKLPAPVVNIPETKIPDYSAILAKMNNLLTSTLAEINKIPKQQKDYTADLLSITDKVEGVLSGVSEKLDGILSNLDRKISVTAKSDELKGTTGNLRYEISILKKAIEAAQAKLEAVDTNISNTMKPAKFLQDIYAILQQSQDLKKLAEEYQKKTEGLQYMGLR